jgi:hypothetical protein
MLVGERLPYRHRLFFRPYAGIIRIRFKGLPRFAVSQRHTAHPSVTAACGPPPPLSTDIRFISRGRFTGNSFFHDEMLVIGTQGLAK